MEFIVINLMHLYFISSRKYLRWIIQKGEDIYKKIRKIEPIMLVNTE